MRSSDKGLRFFLNHREDTVNTFELNNENFFRAFCLFTDLNVKKTPREILLKGIPLKEGESFPDMFAFMENRRLAEVIAAGCGLKSKFIDKKPHEIHPEAAPFILFMKDGGAAIVEKNDTAASSFIVRYDENTVKTISYDEMADISGDVAFLMKKELQNTPVKDGKERNKWFFDAVWLSKWIYADVLAASFFINLFGVVTPLFTMNVYDRIVPNHAVESLWALALGVFIVFVFDAVLKYLRHHFLEISAKKTDLLLSSRLFRKVMDLGLSDRPKVVGSFASNIKDFDMIRNFLSSSSVSVFVDLPFMFLFLFIIAYLAGIIVLIPITVSVIVLIYAFSIKKAMNELVKEGYVLASRKNGMLIESLKAIETIKSFNLGSHKLWEWENVTAQSAEQSKKVKSVSYTMNTFFNFMVNLNTVSVIVAGVYLISNLELTTGGLIAAVMLSSRAVAPLGQAISLITTYDQAKVAFQSIDEIMQKPSETDNSRELISIGRLKGKISFRNVGFKYGEDGAGVLKNVSFTINQGEKVAILGKMGSGKTTVQKLIMGFFRPTDGEVTVDGLAVSQIDPTLLRKNIAYVPQTVELFRGTLKQNISIRKTDADDGEIIKALNTASLTGFVSRHPKGLAADIDEDGRNLSGGQKQAIAIARAFAGGSSIALLDEPTDGIDYNTEMQVIASLKTVLKDKTLVLITHKNNLLELVDRVIVLEEGTVVFDGTKEQMMKKFA